VCLGFVGFSQSRFAEDLICDGMEIDLSYSKDGKLIASHGRQSYFGMINPFASATSVEAFAKLMPTILKRNQSSPDKRFKIIMDTTDIEKSGQMLYDLVDVFSQNLTEEEIESIEFVAMGVGARHDAEKLVKAKYGDKTAYPLTCNRLHLMDITENSDEKDKLELKYHTSESDKIVHTVSDFRDNPKPLVEILEKHQELKVPFQNMEKEHKAYLELYPKSNMLISSTNPDIEAVYKLMEYGLKGVKFDNLPSIHDLPENERTFDDIVKYVKDARPFGNIGNRELRNKQRESGMPYQYHVSDIILTNAVVVSCLCMLKKARDSLGKHADDATNTTRKVVWNTAHAAFLTSYALCLTMHHILLANAFADTEAGLALSVLSQPMAYCTMKAITHLANNKVINQEDKTFKVFKELYDNNVFHTLYFTLSHFSNESFTASENAKAFAYNTLSCIVTNIAVNRLLPALYSRIKDNICTKDLDQDSVGTEMREIIIESHQNEIRV
jgi:glycerophosphoryl diester phosphodiesterase